MEGWKRFARVAAITAAAVMSLASAPRRPYSPREKSVLRRRRDGPIVRPGLTIAVNSAAVAADGTITVSYSLADPNGLPLDSAGVTTPGTISVSFVAAVLPNNQGDYTAYTTRTATGTVIPSTQQPGADSGGVIASLGSGQYQYTFHTKTPTGFDMTATPRLEFMDRET